MHRKKNQTRRRRLSLPDFLRAAASALVGLSVLVTWAGCASTRITSQAPLNYGQLSRPGHVWVYNFASSAAEVPPNSAMAQAFAIENAAKTPDQIHAGRQLGAGIAAQLVAEIRGMGMPGMRAALGTTPQVNDIVIRGYLVSIEEGSAAKRVGIGFGAGASELRTAVEGYQVTARGLRKLGSGTMEAGGSKGPGAALGAATFIATANPVGLIVGSGMKIYGEKSGKSTLEGRAEATAKEIADVLRLRFQEQGWIE